MNNYVILFPNSGRPSPPGLMAVLADLESFIFIITPPTPSQCVRNYSFTSTEGGGMLLNNITLEATKRVMVNASDLDLCNNNYTFTVVALTAAEPGGSRTVYSQAFDNLSE